jgi:nucleotide-binding universal stress UspA family protein
MGMIVVGTEDSLRGQDAVALAADVARASGAEVLAVCAYPYDNRSSAHYNPVMRAPLREAAEATLEGVWQSLSDLSAVHRRAVADVTPARALLAAAETAKADLIVVGSSHAGFSGHVVLGSTAAALLEGSPCPVAVAPQGYRLRPHLPERRVTVAYDGSPNARAALSAAVPLAAAMGARLRLVTVFDPDVASPPWLHVPPGYLRLSEKARRAAHAELEGAAATIPGAEAALLTGDPATELLRESETSGLLIIGSRNYGPAPAVLLGAVSARVAEAAGCPVLIVPNGVGAPLAGLLPECGKLRIDVAA